MVIMEITEILTLNVIKGVNWIVSANEIRTISFHIPLL